MTDKQYKITFDLSDGTQKSVNFTSPQGKSAYEYAKDGGYTGTEEEFAAKMAAENGVKSWNDLTDKPFYSEAGETISWDGNTDGLYALDGLSIYKVADEPIPFDSLSNGFEMTVQFGNDSLESVYIPASDVADWVYYAVDTIFSIAGLAYIAIENTSLSGFVFEKGVYFLKSDDGTMRALTPIKVVSIDRKYIPPLDYVTTYDPVFEGTFSHNRLEGSDIGDSSHAEGLNTTASGDTSHAEGSDTIASGFASHAEGSDTIASGSTSHAEGSDTIASGFASHAEGYGTIAKDMQHVQGTYNVEDSGLQDYVVIGNAGIHTKYLHIVGNGTSKTSRSNAHTLDRDGNAWYQGTVEGTAMIVKSSTEGSTKRFKITVDDSGMISATEIITE